VFVDVVVKTRPWPRGQVFVALTSEPVALALALRVALAIFGKIINNS